MASVCARPMESALNVGQVNESGVQIAVRCLTWLTWAGSRMDQELLLTVFRRTSRSLNKVSNPRVSACMVTEGGNKYFGNNIFLSNCTMSCAEANAFAAAVSNDDIFVKEVYLANSRNAGPADAALTPCGNCRQMLSDLQILTGIPVVVYSTNDGISVHKYSVDQLIPSPFIPLSLSGVKIDR